MSGSQQQTCSASQTGLAAPSPPPPPPLPPQLVGAATPTSTKPVDRPSHGFDSFTSMPEDRLSQGPEPPPSVYEPTYYFFYGSLMRPNILKGVLDLAEEPILRPATIYDYNLANWGQYRALIDAQPGMAVTGCAYKVQSAEDAFKLAHYETNAYTLASCAIYFDGEDQPLDGKVFKYAGDAEALKQGRFDRKLWELRMGARLPPQWRAGMEEGQL